VYALVVFKFVVMTQSLSEGKFWALSKLVYAYGTGLILPLSGTVALLYHHFF
jgi:hypothetical protein